MKKLMLLLGAWIHWIFGQTMSLFFKVLGFAIMSIIMVLASMYVIDYAYEKGNQPCGERWNYSAVIERKLWKPGEDKDRLYLVNVVLTNKETGLLEGRFKAFVTPEQYQEMLNKVTLNIRELREYGYLIVDWGVTIEDI